MRFMFLTIQLFESDFYGEVGAHLRERGHEVVHVTVSRRSARRLRERGFEAVSLLDQLEEDAAADVEAEVARLEQNYDIDSVADVFRTDVASRGLSDAEATSRTVRYFRALEQVFDELRPDVLVPEVGSETPRTAAHAIALHRGIPTLFLFYTIFPNPLRLYVDTMHAPIVSPEEIRALTPPEDAEVKGFVTAFTTRAQPIRPHRRGGITPQRLRHARSYVAARVGEDRDNEYLRPGRWAADHATQLVRRRQAGRIYVPVPAAPFVYFPLHVVDDYKIERVIPHLADQVAIVQQVAEALPDGFELVVKEHPLSIGRNELSLLRRIADLPRVRLVDPHTSSHDLIEQSEAVVVISSTVGLEALLYGKPVLTLGRPFYAGFGVTLDIDSLDEIHFAIPDLLRFPHDRERVLRFLHAAMRRCYAGAPVLVDCSDENARALALSLDRAVGSIGATRSTPAAGAVV